jgi:8-oxo-dGTP pyrophosphatase MutT (NUDIX family)
MSVHKRAAATFIFDSEGRILLAQRGPKARHAHYQWEGPGGLVEEGESFEDAACREVAEELGITDLVIEETLCSYDEIIDEHGVEWQARIYRASTRQAPVIVEPGKCVGFGWFKPEDAAKLDLADYCQMHFRKLGWL